MSASKEKRNRQKTRTEGVHKQAAQQRQEKKQKRKHRVAISLASVIVAFFLAIIILFNTPILYRGATALTIGDTSFSPTDFNYYYYSSYNDYMYYQQLYSSYYGYETDIDTSKSLSSQYYNEEDGTTWADYFETDALTTMKRVVALVAAAEAEGFTLTEEKLQEVETEINDLRESYKKNKTSYSSFTGFLQYHYGNGMSEKIFRKNAQLLKLAEEYSVHKQKSFEYTSEEINAKYQENRNNYDFFSFDYYLVTPAAAAEDGADYDEEAALAEAHSRAETIATAKSADGFKQLVSDYKNEGEESPEPTSSRVQGSDLTSDYDYTAWLKEEGRSPGDVGIVESASTQGYYVVYFTERDDNHYTMPAVRHILVKTEGDSTDDYTTGYTDEAKAAALSKAEELYAKWKSETGMTEDDFAEYAKLYSEDEGSKDKGGLYEDFPKKQMVAEFDAWCYDPARKPGDTGIVYGESSGYSGYHIIYYVGMGTTLYSDTLAKTDLQTEALETWTNAEIEKYESTTNFMMRLTK